ncbi:LuxR C-terminal-related transcriptional regulator [Aquihabitans sp. McL0605]|uniref:LuxR C-terminal-related transcriptional regulator n=1 Tax=Aquihabitans sp. McL0605 TaxID=3415671 RepID=UPI003CE928C9
MTDRPLRVILSNDVELIVEGLRGLLAPYGDRVEVVGTATGDPEILYETFADADADIMLIDAFGRTGAGLDAVEMVLATDPSFAVTVFTEADDLRHLFAALRAGVRGYLLKSIATEDLVSSLERIARGEVVVDPGLATEAAVLAARSSARQKWSGAHLGLSRREAEVLQAIAKGGSVNGVADQLGVGRETVRTHLQQIYRKLGVNDRGGAVAKAWREGLGA